MCQACVIEKLLSNPLSGHLSAYTYYIVLKSTNANEWIVCTRRLFNSLPNLSLDAFVQQYVLPRCDPLFTELITEHHYETLDELFDILTQTCSNKETLAFLWCRLLSTTTDSFCLYNMMKKLYGFFSKDPYGRNMISLVLASLPIELIDLAWTNSFDKFFYGKMLDYFEAHLKSVNKFRFSYNVKLTELNEIRGSDMPKLLSDLQPDWKEALLNSIYDRKQSGKLGKGEEKFLDTLSTRFNTVCIDESENKDALIEK